jgi:type III restriction enzyme
MPGETPILNNPYAEPRLHYWTSPAGELDYGRILKNRRPFVPDVRSIPIELGNQGEMLSMQETHDEWKTHLINLTRTEVSHWREARYPQTTRITRELLAFWFLNDDRDPTQSLFFAQREAIETAVWLNEVAEKSNAGSHILRLIEVAQKTVSTNPSDHLPRVCFKMATGSGKTVVMAALILYHFFNRQEYGNDTRFADNFLIVAPGITIRDRLGVLRVDAGTGHEALDYYTARHLVPKTPEGWRRLLGQLNHHIVITNFHTFEPKTIKGNKRSPFDGKIGPDGRKQNALEDTGAVVSRLLGQFRPGSRVLILNDEAHHCYLPKSDTRKAEGEDAKEENARAAVWYSGIRAVAQRFKVRAVYDLSATPYYLTGSGHPPYSLFPWIVTDFGLTDAIESGLVKIPFLPTWDDTQELEMPVLRDLYNHIPSEELPKAGQKTARSRAKKKGESLMEAPPRLPHLLRLALQKFYEHYEQEFTNRRHSKGESGEAQLELSDSPPVFIVVCNNTSVSKEVYKHVGGYVAEESEDASGSRAVPGLFDLFSNFNRDGQPYERPRTILIDSDALEHGDIVDDEFRRVFAPEVEQFKRDYARIHGQGAAEALTDAQLLREVVNTVGQRGKLGAGIRCIVSVSMLTEGWDANTVTHIVGVRAFGSQLLCEQVAGRALRRRSYFLAPYDQQTGELLPQNTRRTKDVIWKFPPEYAHIIGVPFKLFKGGETVTPPPVDLVRVYPLPERAETCEIAFPNIEGYRIDYPDGPLTWDFASLPDYIIDGSSLPTETILSSVGGVKEKLTIDSILALRDQEIVYRIAKDLLRDHFPEKTGAEGLQLHRFHEVRQIVADWYHSKVRVLGKGPEWKKLLYFRDPKEMVTQVARGIAIGQGEPSRIRPILNHYNPTSSTRFVRGQTARETYDTRHSHINVVVIDSGWEGRIAKTLDDLAEEGHILSWVKNAFLQFRIPYTANDGRERDYHPDFIIHARLAGGPQVCLILEITGFHSEKTAKKFAVEHRWLPAANAIHRRLGLLPWDFMELDAELEVADARNRILAKLRELALARPLSGIWAARREHELEHGLIQEDFDLPERRIDLRKWATSPLDD